MTINNPDSGEKKQSVTYKPMSEKQSVTYTPMLNKLSILWALDLLTVAGFMLCKYDDISKNFKLIENLDIYNLDQDEAHGF